MCAFNHTLQPPCYITCIRQALTVTKNTLSYGSAEGVRTFLFYVFIREIMQRPHAYNTSICNSFHTSLVPVNIDLS